RPGRARAGRPRCPGRAVVPRLRRTHRHSAGGGAQALEDGQPMSAANAPLRCERLVVGYAGRPLLPPCDLEIGRGRLTMVLGRNGSGKSTLFRTLLVILSPLF